jgi:mRNA interferase YafQ
VRRVLIPSPAFVRAFKRITKKQGEMEGAIRDALGQLGNDAFDPSLRTHKLQGDLAGCWASSAGYDLRIVFRLVQHEGKESILLLSVGTHDEVY